MKRILIIIFLLQALHATAQTSWIIQPFNYEYKRGLFDSSLRVPVMNTDRAFFTNKDSIGLLWFNADSIKLLGRFPGNIIKSFVTYDTIVALKNQQLSNFIQNQNLATQTANFRISGNGSSATYNTYNASAAAYSPFYSLATDAIDTTKRLWSIGLQLTPGIGNSGANIVFRSYTTTGVFIANAMSISRSGNATAPIFNATTQLTTLGGTGGGGITLGTGASISSTLAHGGATYSNGTSTVTGDYTTSNTDTWINVNNSANCTITINNPGSGLAAAGRVYYIKKISNNAATVTIVCTLGGVTIDGNSSAVISAYNSSITLHDDGTNWFIY